MNINEVVDMPTLERFIDKRSSEEILQLVKLLCRIAYQFGRRECALAIENSLPVSASKQSQ